MPLLDAVARPKGRRGTLRPLECALVALLTVVAAACSDSAVAPRPRPLARFDVNGSTGASTPIGIGGSYSMSAAGEKIIALPLAGTGIRVPAGIPVRVRVTGAITRTQTAGLQAFCALPRWQMNCQTIWADIVAETPIPPSGLAAVGDLGAALVGWDGGSGSPPPEGSTIAFRGPSGTELWAGRSEWGCYYFDTAINQGPCFTFGGGYTVVVEADDGSDPDAGGGGGGGEGGGGGSDSTAILQLAILESDVGPLGGPVKLAATAKNAAPIEGRVGTSCRTA